MTQDKKRLHSQISKDDEQQETETTLDETSSDLLSYILNHYNYSNLTISAADDKQSESFLKYRKLSNVVIKTTFKDYYLNDLFAKRSGLLKKMIDSNKEWNLGKDDEGRFIIDLRQVQDSILNLEECTLEESDFDLIFKFLYSDKIEKFDSNENNPFEKAKKLIQLAKYFDMNHMLTQILNRDCEIFSLAILVEVKNWMGMKLTEEDYFVLLCSVEDEIYSVELANLICQESNFPFDCKCHVLVETIKYENGIENEKEKFTEEMLKPFNKSLELLKKESKHIIKGSNYFSTQQCKQMAELLGIEFEEIDYKSIESLNGPITFSLLDVTYNSNTLVLFGILRVSIECYDNTKTWEVSFQQEWGREKYRFTIYYSKNAGKTIKKETFYSSFSCSVKDESNDNLIMWIVLHKY